MKVGDLRRGLLVTQSEIGAKLGLDTKSVAWTEDQEARWLGADSLAAYVEALGGRLEAVIPAPHGTERRVKL